MHADPQHPQCSSLTLSGFSPIDSSTFGAYDLFHELLPLSEVEQLTLDTTCAPSNMHLEKFFWAMRRLHAVRICRSAEWIPLFLTLLRSPPTFEGTPAFLPRPIVLELFSMSLPTPDDPELQNLLQMHRRERHPRSLWLHTIFFGSKCTNFYVGLVALLAEVTGASQFLFMDEEKGVVNRSG